MLRTLEGTLDPEGHIQFSEAIRLTKPHRVLVTLLHEESAQAAGEVGLEGNLHPLQALLDSPAFRERPYGSPEEMEAQIQENREAWEG